jgi:hypothetical protein
MEKPKKQKKPRKPLNVKIDTKIVDVEINRDADGNTTIDVDSPIVDVHVEKNDSGKSVEIEIGSIDDRKEYTFESNGTSKLMPKGTLWKITGEILKIFLKRKLGNIKN